MGEVKASPNADTTILFVKGEGTRRSSAVRICSLRVSGPHRSVLLFQTSQPTTSSSSCSVSPTRGRRTLSWSLWMRRSVTPRCQEVLRGACLCVRPPDTSLSASGLSVLHPELHGPPARRRGPSQQTGHLRVLLHPGGADGGTSLRTRHQPQLQGRQRKETSVWARTANRWLLTSDL